jgi:photosystem II stability/assembly factor-like uncharacterized protein
MAHLLKRSVALLAVAVLLTGLPGVQAWARLGQWSRLPSPTNPVLIDTMAVAPSNGDVLYAGTRGTIYRSDDAGLHWSQTAFLGPWVRAVAVDPEDPLRAYAAAWPGLYRTSNGGKRWILAVQGYFDSVAVEPGDPDSVFAGSDGGAFRSRDRGVTWSAINQGLPQSADVLALAIAPSLPRRIYAGVLYPDGGVYRSDDHGRTWKPTTLTLPIVALAVRPDDPKTVYASTGPGTVYISTDGGVVWTSSLAVEYGVPALAIDPFHPDTVYAASEYFGVYRRNPDGTWELRNHGRPGCTESVAVDPISPQVVYAACFGVTRSSDGASRWQSRSNGLEIAADVSSVTVDPQSPSRLFVTTYQPARVFASFDGGQAWRPRGHGLPESYETDYGPVVPDPASPDTLYLSVDTAGRCGCAYKSTDAGRHWRDSSQGLTSSGPIAIDPVTPSTLYMGTESGVYKTTDGASTWILSGLDGIEVHLLAAHPRDPRILYAAGYAEGHPDAPLLYKSIDGGAAWTRIGNPGIVISLAFDPGGSSVVYAGTEYYHYYGEVGAGYKSTDGGLTWSRMALDVPQGESVLVAADGRKDYRLYASVDPGVHRSIDGGATWQDFSEGLPPGDSAGPLAFDTSDWRTIYALVGHGGWNDLYRYGYR